MSSTPPNQPRLWVLYYGDEPKEFTKLEYLELYSDDPVWDYSADDLIYELELTVPELYDQSELVPNFERFRSHHLANGGISNKQDEILSTVSKKIQDWAERASAMLLSLKARPDEIDDRAIYFVRQSKILFHHVGWLEYFARADPQNINAMIQDALEFPDPPRQPEDEQVEPAEQAEKGEKTE
ncbi:hypothetical protein F4680DRAFT_442610 [Xylaria scruposa]|nr:hypothetical protein F4680DRAFT_442610 [Xylaria scruposa]